MNSTEEGLLYRVEALERKKAIWDELCKMREELAPLVDALESPLEVQCMRMRYLEGRSVREISYNLAYSEQHVFRVIGNAEREIQSAE
jgi:hypothetical protein